MSKLFTVAGTSVLEGVCKFRVANGSADARAKVLEKNGHTDIALQDLPTPMSKEDAMVFLNYVEGKAVTPKAAKPAAAPKAKVAEKEFKIQRKAPEVKAEKAPEDVEAVRAKNLETMRAVTLKHKALDAIHKQVREEFAEIEAEMDKLTADDIPAIFRKECGFAE
jgi:hypothetical protein